MKYIKIYSIKNVIYCYECESDYALSAYQCPDGLYVVYCKKCIKYKEHLKHLRV